MTMTKDAQTLRKAKTIMATFTPEGLHMGLYTVAYLAAWAGRSFGGGYVGAIAAINEAQSRADAISGIIDRGEHNQTDELRTVIAVANRLFEDSEPLDAA